MASNTIPASINDISNLAMLCGALRDTAILLNDKRLLEIQMKMERVLDKYFPE